MVGKSFFTICVWFFYNSINFQVSDNNTLDYLTYRRGDTIHVLYFENRYCIGDSFYIDKQNKVYEK